MFSILRLEGVLSAGKAGSYITVSGRRLILNVKHSPVPHDVVLVSEEGEEIECHKCILVARSGTATLYALVLLCYMCSEADYCFVDYFQSMLMMGWREVCTYPVMISLSMYLILVCCLLAQYPLPQYPLFAQYHQSNTSDKVTKLKQPISAPILKLVVDYLYTDQRPQITGDKIKRDCVYCELKTVCSVRHKQY